MLNSYFLPQCSVQERKVAGALKLTGKKGKSHIRKMLVKEFLRI